MEVFLQKRESFNKSTKFGRTCNPDWQLFTSERKHERCQFRQHKDCTLSKVSMRNFRSNFIQKYISQSQSTQSTLHLHRVPVLRVETGDLHSRWIKNQTDFGILSKNIGSLSPRCSAIPINQSLAHICTKSLLRSNEIHATTLSPFTIRIANKLSYFSQFFSHIDDHKFINFDFK